MAATEVPEPRMRGSVECDECGQWHVAEFSHLSQFDGVTPVYAVICTEDPEWLVDYYREEVVVFA